ncbi:MAG TPA: OmpA family protein [Longimicrobiales bacterium]|nr:OmpA family protein [Longimicrobiales bacterium]
MQSSKVMGAALLASLSISGCGYAKRTDVTAQLDEVRAAMRAGDEQVGQQAGQQATALGGRVDENARRIAAIERDLQALRSDFNVRIDRLEGRLQGLLAFNVPVHFDFAKADVRPTDTAVLDRFAAVVKEYYPGSVITIEGFTDPAGSAAYNQRLGAARAAAVKTYLVSQGIASAQLRTVSYGEARERLVVPNASRDEGLPNRRVVLVVDMFAGVGRPIT